MQIIRQGDVLVRQIKALPKRLARAEAENGRLVLAHGEVTGHHHSFEVSNRITMFRDDGAGGGGLFLSVAAPVALEHQEHTAIPLAPGHHEVRRQREYHPEVLRNVQD